ncbi:MAG TPA: hypothetical protein VD865_09045 [Stenotrophomonas sp.]|nr:hypothetical protein [Stenotrophomonas sp.]
MTRPLRSRRLWLGAAVAAAVLLVLLLGFKRPLAQWLWPDTRIQQLLAQGEHALAQGRLSAPDGSGARESFEAALALDSDRGEARDGLARTGSAALLQGRRALARNDVDTAKQALALARVLQVPRKQSDALATLIREHEAARAGLDELVTRASRAREQGRLDGEADSALPLYQRVLELAPARLDALEGREDALSDLLQQGRGALAHGDLAAAAACLRAARNYDPGHAELPASEAAFNDAVQSRLRRVQERLRQGRLAQADADLRLLAGLQPDLPEIARSSEQLANAYAAEAVRRAQDFDFEAATSALAQARAWTPDAASLRNAEQAVARARQAQASQQPALPAAARARRLRQLLTRIERAEAQQHWLTPPGESAYDALREAQALAPRDPRVRNAAARLVPQTRACFEENLRANRVRGAQACLDAWQVLALRDDGLIPARRRLAQRWIALGSERLGAGDAVFAAEAVQQAARLDPRAADLADLQARVRAAEGRGP